MLPSLGPQLQSDPIAAMIDAELVRAREKAEEGSEAGRSGGHSDKSGKQKKPYIRPWDRGKSKWIEGSEKQNGLTSLKCTSMYIHTCTFQVSSPLPLSDSHPVLDLPCLPHTFLPLSSSFKCTIIRVYAWNICIQYTCNWLTGAFLTWNYMYYSLLILCADVQLSSNWTVLQ